MKSADYYKKYAAAYVRGAAIQSDSPYLPRPLIEKRLDELSDGELEEIIAAGDAAGLKLYRFKSTHDDLPRVRRVLGFLKSIEMNSLLDAGSGRGVFLWPCLNAFPYLEVHSVDMLPRWAEMLNAVRLGGVSNLSAEVGDFCSIALADKTFDVVTMLEVLEHIPDVSAAIRTALRVARRYVVVTAPSKPDNNPEHIHLLTKEVLTGLFTNAGCARLHFDAIPGHIFMVAVLEA